MWRARVGCVRPRRRAAPDREPASITARKLRYRLQSGARGLSILFALRTVDVRDITKRRDAPGIEEATIMSEPTVIFGYGTIGRLIAANLLARG